LTLSVFFLSGSGSLGKGRRSTGTTGIASFLHEPNSALDQGMKRKVDSTHKRLALVRRTGGAGGLSSSSAIASPEVWDKSNYQLIAMIHHNPFFGVEPRKKRLVRLFNLVTSQDPIPSWP
jgi:hypothetical protein